MQFQSVAYLVFFALVFAAYWALPHRGQNVLLLASSYVFYGWVHWWFLLLIAASTITDFACALGMERWPALRKRLLWVSLGVNLGMLAAFKYFGFFVENVRAALGAFGVHADGLVVDILLPVGISFYTFQTLSYTIDVYRREMRACRNLLDFSVYVSFFPQLVAGPIERASRLLPQVEQPRHLDLGAVRSGLALAVWGFFKKLVIADNVALIADKVFGLDDPGVALLTVGTLAFCVQIYADFSGYTDVARGCARLLGFELMRNFDHPYVSQSPAEFWRRWHISLSTWIRDYLYIPLGGSRASAPRAAFNLVTTFFLCGLWHGASNNFALWGLYHGVLILGYRYAFAAFPRLEASRWLAFPRWAVFFVLTNVGWLLFREHDLAKLARTVMDPALGSPEHLLAAAYLLPRVVVFGTPLVLHWVLDWSATRGRWREREGYQYFQAVAAAVSLMLTAALHSESTGEFIYFQF